MASRSYTYASGYPAKPAVPKPSGRSLEYMARKLNIKSVKSTTPTMSQSSKKRKAASPPPTIGYDEEEDEDEFTAAWAHAHAEEETKPKKARRKKGEEPEEKRLKRFRQKPPQSYLERLDRARTQRMFLIDRQRQTSEDSTHEEEVIDIAGSTGNIYQVTIGKLPKCTCPDNGKGNQCKHIVYVLINVLKTRSDLAYQLAFLSTELAEILANAPLPTSNSEPSLSTDTGGSRKPVEGDCPVCCMEFEASNRPADILWCKAACGQNIHKTCFEQWARSKPGQVKCVYCRSVWKSEGGDMKSIKSGGGKVGADGYVNVASELGISGERDMSSYHQYWVNREFGYGRGRYGGY